MNGSSVFGPRVTVARRRVSAKKLRRKRDSQRNGKIEEHRGGGGRGRSRAGKKLIGPSGSAIASVNQARYVPGSVSSLSYGQRGVRLISTRPSFSPLSSGPVLSPAVRRASIYSRPRRILGKCWNAEIGKRRSAGIGRRCGTTRRVFRWLQILITRCGCFNHGSFASDARD